MTNPNERGNTDYEKILREHLCRELEHKNNAPLTDQLREIVELRLEVEARQYRVEKDKDSESFRNIGVAGKVFIESCNLPDHKLKLSVFDDEKSDGIQKFRDGLTLIVKHDVERYLIRKLENAANPNADDSTVIGLYDDVSTMTESSVYHIRQNMERVFIRSGLGDIFSDIIREGNQSGFKGLLDELSPPGKSFMYYIKRDNPVSIDPTPKNFQRETRIESKIKGVFVSYIHQNLPHLPITSLYVLRTP